MSNGPRVVCAGCGAETSLFKPFCDKCMESMSAYIPREHVLRMDCWCMPKRDDECPEVVIHNYEQ